MRLKRDDREYERNLKLLVTVSKIESIYLRALHNENVQYFRYLNSRQGRAFKRFLNEYAYPEHFLSRDEAEIILDSSEQLLDFLPDADLVPERFEKIYAIHKRVVDNRIKTNKLDVQLSEHKKLQQLVSRSRNDSEELTDFLNDRGNKTPSFDDFCQTVLKTPESMLNAKYWARAMSVAKQYGFYTEEFKAKLTKLLTKPVLKLATDSVQRTFTTGKKLLPGAALGTAITIAALTNLNVINLDSVERAAAESNPHEISMDFDSNTNNAVNLSNLDYSIITPPISTNTSIDSYDDVCRDFFQKTGEVYHHQTGKNVNFNGYGRANIDCAETTIYTVSYNGQTYRFSTLSEHRTTAKYLKEALQSVPGATITSTQTDDITYIHRYGASEAIVDSSGNPVRSGAIMEKAHDGSSEMYNQSMIKQARRILENSGTNTSQMTEAQIIGWYILSNNYNVQNPELSAALAETSGLAHFIDDYCLGDTDSYTVDLYRQESNDFATAFNSQALEGQAVELPQGTEPLQETPDLGEGPAISLRNYEDDGWEH